MAVALVFIGGLASSPLKELAATIQPLPHGQGLPDRDSDPDRRRQTQHLRGGRPPDGEICSAQNIPTW